VKERQQGQSPTIELLFPHSSPGRKTSCTSQMGPHVTLLKLAQNHRVASMLNTHHLLTREVLHRGIFA
jgi:hypothetical protein